jgi:hypothetical protein
LSPKTWNSSPAGHNPFMVGFKFPVCVKSIILKTLYHFSGEFLFHHWPVTQPISVTQ